MTLRRSLIAAAALLAALLACSLPTSGTPTPATCPTDSLLPPALSDPADLAILSSTLPTLSWTYPLDCDPEGYRIDLSTDFDFADTSLSGGTGNPSTSWAPGSALLPGETYYWRVAPINGTTLGPFSGQRTFFIGPLCPEAGLAAPVLVEPADGAAVSESLPLLAWDNPQNCLPESYRVDLATDPSFADTSLSGGTGNPWGRWFPGDPLADCTTYYWRIAPFTGSTLGPYSPTRSFSTDFTGTCEAELGEPPLPSLTPSSAPAAAATTPPPAPAATTPAPPACTPADFAAPYPYDPPDGATVSSLTPTLWWDYGTDSPCTPPNYRILLGTSPDLASPTQTITAPHGEMLAWTPAPLLPNTRYYWKVAVVAAEPNTYGPWSPTVSFRTPAPTQAQPACPFDAPQLAVPTNGAIVTEIWPRLYWRYTGNCQPPGYRIDLATDSSFADTSLSGGTGNPTTNWAPGAPLADCTIYYWRVAAVSTEGMLGPWSATWSFKVDTTGGKCGG